MKKPLSITSPDHAIALSMYFMLGLSGLLGVLNLNKTSGAYEAMGDLMSDVFSTTLMIFGFVAFFSAMSAKKRRRPENSLTYEMYACAGIAVDLLYFLSIVFINFGSRGFSTGSFAMIFVVGSSWRFFQIISEQKAIKKARASQVTADESLLADPREDHDRSL
jgi:hypothetical protein